MVSSDEGLEEDIHFAQRCGCLEIGTVVSCRNGCLPTRDIGFRIMLLRLLDVSRKVLQIKVW